jgi:hypothetical protein
MTTDKFRYSVGEDERSLTIFVSFDTALTNRHYFKIALFYKKGEMLEKEPSEDFIDRWTFIIFYPGLFKEKKVNWFFINALLETMIFKSSIAIEKILKISILRQRMV